MSEIITVLLFAAVMIVASVRKSRREAARRKRRIEMEMESPRPGEMHRPPVFRRKIEVPEPWPVPKDFPADALPRRVKRRKADSAAAGKPQKDAAAMDAGSSTLAKNRAEQPKAAEPPKSEAPSVEGDKGFEFDLRRAVIEAEILTPKFEQY